MREIKLDILHNKRNMIMIMHLNRVIINNIKMYSKIYWELVSPQYKR